MSQEKRRGRKKHRRRKLKKWVKVSFLVIVIIVALILIGIFGFKLQSVTCTSDLGQFTDQEVNAYMSEQKIDNTLVFWFKSLIGENTPLELYEEYKVKLLSPSKVKITGYEKKLQGYIKKDKLYYYFDENGTILKISDEKIKDIVPVKGLEATELKLFKKIKVKDEKSLETILTVTSSVEAYNYKVKQYSINKNNEVTMNIKNVKVQLDKKTNLDKKLKDFNDMYKNVIKYKGTLNMKHASEDGSYTLKKSEEKKK